MAKPKSSKRNAEDGRVETLVIRALERFRQFTRFCIFGVHGTGSDLFTVGAESI